MAPESMPYAAQLIDILDSLQVEGGEGARSRFVPRAAYPRALAGPAGMLERLRAELRFADQLCALYPDRAEEWRARILEAGRAAQAGLRGSPIDVAALVGAAEAVLAPIGAAAKEYTLLCVSHAHIDMNWMWSWPETVAVTHDTFQTMLALMDEYPAFIYTQSQASTYRLIEQYNPGMFEQIRQRVREGRWEVTASQWVEGDKNMSSGESISRHLLYSRAYFQDRFGLSPEDVQVDYEPDTFGHPATLPTILARGGVRYYYHCRGSHGPHLYWWMGGDGSRILVFNDSTWYMSAIEPEIADPLVEFSLTTGLKCRPVLYGVGDHGGGPTRRDLRRISEMDAWPVYPNVQCSTLHDFYRHAEAQAANVPEVEGERNFVFPGCYTSQARQKEANRHGENILYSAESAATVGARLAGVPYPHDRLDEAWKKVLFDQFHDILPGSGVRATRHYTLGHAQETQAAASMARSHALRALSERVNTAALLGAFAGEPGRAYKDRRDGERAFGAGVGNAAGAGGESSYSSAQGSDRAFLVYNPLPYERAAVVEAKLWDVTLDRERLVATLDPASEGGLDPQPVQVLDSGAYWGHTYLTVAFPVQLPAMGYRSVCVSDRKAELGLVEEGIVDPWAGQGGSFRKIVPLNWTLENEWVKVVVDPATGCLSSLVDKGSGREWAPEGGLTGILQRCLEANQGMTAWVIGQYLERRDLLGGGTVKRVHDGPHVQTVRWTYPHGQIGAYDTTLELDITVRRGAPRVEFSLRVDWREIGHKEGGIPQLKLRFPLATSSAQARYEVPFGSVARPMLGDQDVPAQRWVDLSEEDGAGVTLVNSSKYGFSVEPGAEGTTSLNMTLLRASIDPDPLPDLGEHTIAYALVPHGAGWTVGDCVQAGEAFNIPPVVLSCGFHEGALPCALSLVEIENQNVRLGAIKEGQDGDSIVLRLFEVEGLDSEARIALSPDLVGAGAAAVEVDILERPLDSNGAALQEGVLRVRLPAYGVTTVCIKAS